MAQNYLELLRAALNELPDLLEDRSCWDSLIVNRRKPYTYRVFTKLANGMRCCLHRFDPCHTHESFDHPHPWPGAFVILQGSYQMKVGYAPDRLSQPVEVLNEVLTVGSMYSITNPLTFHAITPLEETYTIMINGEPWESETAHTSVRTTKGKDLDKMPEDELLAHLSHFKTLVRYVQVGGPLLKTEK